jgi:hypothetical protein
MELGCSSHFFNHKKELFLADIATNCRKVAQGSFKYGLFMCLDISHNDLRLDLCCLRFCFLFVSSGSKGNYGQCPALEKTSLP